MGAEDNAVGAAAFPRLGYAAFGSSEIVFGAHYPVHLTQGQVCRAQKVVVNPAKPA